MTSPLHVAMLIHDYLPHIGGAERQLAALAPALAERGVDVSILTRRKPGLAGFERIDGVAVHRAALLPGKPLASLAYSLSSLKTLARIKPDLLHVHGLFGTMTTGLLAKSAFRTPVVAKLLRGGPTLGDIDRLRAKLLGDLRLRAIAENIDGFIAITPELTRELQGIGVADSRCHAIPNGVDTGRFHPVDRVRQANIRASLGLPEAAPIVLFSGRLEREKRVDRLLSIWPAMRKNHPDALLMIAGDGSESATLRNQAPEGVQFAGALDDVVPYLQAADVFALPSMAEGLSNAILEALASGLAVAVSDLPANRDLIQPGETGLLAAVDDDAGLTETLSILIANPDLRGRLGVAARSMIERDYSLANTADRLAALYRRVLSQRHLSGHIGATKVMIDG